MCLDLERIDMTKETGYTRDEENISYMYTLPE